MLTRPEGLSDDDVAEAVHRGWGLDVMAVEHLRVGFGSHHWKVVGPGHRWWFITVDDLAPLRTADMALGRLQAALTTARQLRERGLSFVVAPVPDCDEVVVRRVGDRWAMAAYPYVDGRSEASGRYRSDEDLRAVLELLVELHAVPPGLAAARTDDFAIPRRGDLERALTQLDEPWIGGPHAEPARELLASRSTDVERRLRRLDHLAAEARARPDHRVITHGEPHAGAACTLVTAGCWSTGTALWWPRRSETSGRWPAATTRSSSPTPRPRAELCSPRCSSCTS